LPPTTNPNWNPGGLKDRPRISISTKYYISLGNKRNHQIQVNNNLRKKMVEKQHNTKCWARLSTNCCTLFWRSSLHTCVSTKSSIRLGSRPRVIACKIKMLSVKYIYKKQQIKKMDVIKKILPSTSQAKWTEVLVCVVTEPWICKFRFPTPDCDHHVKHSDITCWMYSAHIVFGMYGSWKSFQTTTSFQLCRVLSFSYFLVFFVSCTKTHVTYMVQTNYL
jgi:hypothetical protein